MIVPQRLTVTDFGILAEAQIDFPKKGGMLYVRGVNHDIPNASSNATGKSTVLNALVWCLYEADTQGRRIAEDAIRYGACSCSVRLDILCDGAAACITRTRHKKAKLGSVIELDTLLPDGNTLKQEDAQRWINATFGQLPAFLACHILAYDDGYVPYALRSDKDQKSVFDRLLNFEDVDKAYANAEAKYTELCRKVQKLSVKRAALEAALTTYKSINACNSSYTNEIAKLQESIPELYAAYTCARDVANAHEGAQLALADKLETLQNALQTAKDDYIDQNTTLRALRAAVDAQRPRIEAVRGRDTCGVCGARLKKGKWKELLGGLWEEHKSYLARIAKLEDSYDFEGERNKIEKLEQSVTEARISLEDAKKAANESNLRCVQSMYALKEAKNKLQELRKRGDDKHFRRATIYARILCVLDDILESLNQKLFILSFWKEGFGRNGIRAYRLARITPRLNVIAEDMSRYLFGDGTKVVYSTQSELKSGEFKDKFSVVLKKNDKTLERPSAGQAARRDIINLLSMAQMAREVHGTRLKLTALDESFRTIDTRGVASCVELLRELTPFLGTVLVVEHDNELASMFDREIVVERKNGRATARVC